MGTVLEAKEKMAAAKKLAIAAREAKSPFRKGELVEGFLLNLVETVEILVEREAAREAVGVDRGE